MDHSRVYLVMNVIPQRKVVPEPEYKNSHVPSTLKSIAVFCEKMSALESLFVVTENAN